LRRQEGKPLPANSIIGPLSAGYETCAALARTGNLDDDWTSVRAALAACGCKRLGQVAEEAPEAKSRYLIQFA